MAETAVTQGIPRPICGRMRAPRRGALTPSSGADPHYSHNRAKGLMSIMDYLPSYVLRTPNGVI